MPRSLSRHTDHHIDSKDHFTFLMFVASARLTATASGLFVIMETALLLGPHSFIAVICVEFAFVLVLGFVSVFIMRRGATVHKMWVYLVMLIALVVFHLLKIVQYCVRSCYGCVPNRAFISFPAFGEAAVSRASSSAC